MGKRWHWPWEECNGLEMENVKKVLEEIEEKIAYCSKMLNTSEQNLERKYTLISAKDAQASWLVIYSHWADLLKDALRESRRGE